MLYHVSFDVLDKIEEFEPRVPDNRMSEEDDTSLRICCSDSVEKALIALPNNVDFLISGKLFPLVKVYEIDESKIESIYLLTPQLIQNKVPDAINTKEHWITTNIKPINSYIIQVTSMDYNEKAKNINNFKYYKLTKEDELQISNYYCFNIKVQASNETLQVLNNKEIKDDDVCNLNALLSKANDIIENTINYISYEPTFDTIDINKGLKIHVDGYFEGEYRDFIHQEKDVIDGIKKELYPLTSKYKLNLVFQ